MMNRLLLAFLAFSLIYSSCSPKQDQPEGDRVVFRYSQPNAVTSLDPAFSRNLTNIWAVDHLYNGLVQFDDQLVVKPAIADSWEISPDGRTYTFKLRQDVRFHDDECFPEGKGRTVNAGDFVYSFNRILDKTVNSPGSWIFEGRVADENPFSATDDNTFVVKLKEAFRPMLGILCMQYCSVVPEEAVNHYGGQFRAKAVGTGAFKQVKWLENQALILEKNQTYFETGLPYVDVVRVDFMGDRNTAYLEFSGGKLDFMSGLEASFADNLLTKQGDLKPELASEVDFYKAPFLNMEYFGILMDKENPDAYPAFMADKRVRQALNYGFDRQKMLQTLRNNVGKPANAGFIPFGLPSHDPSKVKGYSYDPGQAARLLADAGFPDGQGLGEITLNTSNDYLDVCTFITRQWEELGVRVKINVMQSATLRETMRKGKAGFFRASWIADYPDAENFLGLFYSKNPAPPNYTRFKNEDFDLLYEKALRENDDVKRWALYQEMDRLLVEEAPVIFLYYDETARFSKKKVTGYGNSAINLLKVKQLKKE